MTVVRPVTRAALLAALLLWLAVAPALADARRMLEESETLDDAVAILRRAHRSQGHNLLVASGDEDAAIADHAG